MSRQKRILTGRGPVEVKKKWRMISTLICCVTGGNTKPDPYKFDVFVSYSRAPVTRVWVKRYIIGPKDREKRTGVTFVDWLEHHLGHEPRVFYDDHGLEVGDKWAKKILAPIPRMPPILTPQRSP